MFNGLLKFDTRLFFLFSFPFLVLNLLRDHVISEALFSMVWGGVLIHYSNLLAEWDSRWNYWNRKSKNMAWEYERVTWFQWGEIIGGTGLIIHGIWGIIKNIIPLFKK